MQIKQIEVNMENILEFAEREDVYIVKMTEYQNRPHHAKPKLPRYYGVSLRSVTSNMTLKELRGIINDNQGAFVQIENFNINSESED